MIVEKLNRKLELFKIRLPYFGRLGFIPCSINIQL